MKRDLDRLMEARRLDAMLAIGKANNDPSIYYLMNGTRLVGGGFVIKKRGQEPVLFHNPIDGDDAAASGLQTINLNKYDYRRISREAADELLATVELYRRIFADLGIGGRVGFYGLRDQGSAWLLLNALQAKLDGVEVYGDFGESLIDAARACKEPEEVARIRDVSRRTCTVFTRTVEYLRSHRLKDELLIQADDTPLTVGRVHQEISRFITEQHLEDPEGFVFSIGRDAGIPHSRGRAADLVILGQTIIFDLFPREAGGGYFSDVTRTFCLGYAPPEVEMAHRLVCECLEMIIRSYEVGTPVRRYQQMACEFFESHGHPTIGSDTCTEVGYVHTVGHGVGLAVHEEPFFADVATNTKTLQPGHVIACEPGLYYPDRDFGVRVEDVLWVDPAGAIENLIDLGKELVISV